MTLDVTLPIALRAAGPALFVLLGIVVTMLSGGRRDRLAIGAFLALFGAWFVASNIGIAGGGAPFFYVALAFSIAAAGAAIASLVVMPPAERPRAHALALVCLVAALYSALYVRTLADRLPRSGFAQIIPVEALPAFTTYATLGGPFYMLAFALPGAWALVAWRAPPERIGVWAGLAAGIQVFAAFAVGSDILSGDNAVLFVDPLGALGLVAGYAGLWLWVAVRRESRTARNVALATLAAMLAGMLRHATSGYDSAFDPLGSVGLARLVGWTIVATTLVRAGWFDTGFLSRHRAGLAAVALASLFIVAQIAENYVDAEYGLLMGGVVAGALLFAAAPIQRAFEGTRRPEARHATPPPTTRGEESYRKALRIALHDRKLTREEEMHLHELARDLGIDGPRAHALLVEIEAERESASADVTSQPR